MRIEKVKIKNFRSITEAEINLDSLTALIGENNAGKSTILKAIKLFFEGSPRVEKEDYSQWATSENIEITITFSSLTPDELSEFGSAVIDEKLTVSRFFSLIEADSGQYSVHANFFSGFEEIRAEKNGNKRNQLYRSLSNELSDLPSVSSHTEIDEALTEWEQNNKDRCAYNKVRGFFGAQNVASGKLKKKTNIHLISALQDIADDVAQKNRSPIISLLSDITKQTIENRKEFSEFIKDTQDKFLELSDPSEIPELADISSSLTNSIKRFYSDSELKADWELANEMNYNLPTPKIVVEHDGIVNPLSSVGHGLQRAALLSIVQYLAERHSNNNEEEVVFDQAASDIIILLEEPEIYQHPSKQFVIFEALQNIVKKFDNKTGIRVQIIYTTHSEKFIPITNFNIARIIRRYKKDDSHHTCVSGITIEQASEGLANLHSPAIEAMSNEAFIAKLHIFNREMCEGFFSKKIILVEGVTDKSILEAAFLYQGISPIHESISIIPVDGKTKMSTPGFIFSKLEIPTYLVFDNDYKDTLSEKEKKSNIKTNQYLQRVCGHHQQLDWPEGVFDNFTALPCNLEKYFNKVLGEKYKTYFDEVSKDFELDYVVIKKTPAALRKIFELSKVDENEFPMIDGIISKVTAMS